MGSSEFIGYCSFTKAIEHLGDRWSLLIVRELGLIGPQGFNDLVAGLPGRISRSVLADRLHRLEVLGLVSHRASYDGNPGSGYALTDVGLGLMGPLGALRVWADTWLPDDPEMVERDPDVLLNWLVRRTDPATAPRRPVVLELRLRHDPVLRYWLVIHQGAAAYGCHTDPLLEPGRYVWIDSSLPAILALARGRVDWSHALRDGSVTASGDPRLLERLTYWFRPAEGRADVGPVGVGRSGV
jgi:DNA-binding HxlR family transcriptional regulator